MCARSLTSPGPTNTHLPATLLLFLTGIGQHEGAPGHDLYLAHARSLLRRTGDVEPAISLLLCRSYGKSLRRGLGSTIKRKMREYLCARGALRSGLGAGVCVCLCVCVWSLKNGVDRRCGTGPISATATHTSTVATASRMAVFNFTHIRIRVRGSAHPLVEAPLNEVPRKVGNNKTGETAFKGRSVKDHR